MARNAWTPEQLQRLRDLYPDHTAKDVARMLGLTVGSVYGKAALLGLGKSEAFKASERSGRLLPGRLDDRHRSGQFKPGLVPWNKGQHYQAGGRSVETRFKPGQRGSNWRPVGSYRINSEGYLDVKVSETGYGPRDWKGVHRIVWERRHGPVPSGHVVVFKPGQRTNVLELLTVDRLECISRAENARRNHPNNRSAEYARLVQLKGAITRQVNRIAKEQQA